MYSEQESRDSLVYSRVETSRCIHHDGVETPWCIHPRELFWALGSHFMNFEEDAINFKGIIIKKLIVDYLIYLKGQCHEIFI